MPLRLPSLDDRTWTDLTAEGLALIPRYAPTWTNQNVSDPGITLVELFAWLTEMTIYRLDRISPRHRHKFLELLGFEMQLPQAAAAFLNFVPAMGTDSFELPAGVQFQAVSSAGLSVPFRTLNTLDISPVNLRAIQVDQGDGNIQDFTTPWSDQTLVAAFGLNPQPGAAEPDSAGAGFPL
jgi:predicted phage baseplate assembly protein